MSKTLIIVESPIKAKEIRHVLDSSYIVEASYGHIFDLPKSEMELILKRILSQNTALSPIKQKLN